MNQAHIGLITGLLAAMCSAATGLLVKGVGARLPPISLNAWRCTVASVIFVPIWLIWNKSGLPSLEGFLWITLAVTFSIVLGDTSYFFAIEKLGVAKATPIAKAYPIFAVLFSFYAFSEPLGEVKLVGVMLAIAGTTLMSQKPKVGQAADPHGQAHAVYKDHWIGVALALGTAVAWALGAVVLKKSLTKADVITVSLVKTVMASVMLWSIASRVDPSPSKSIFSNKACLLLATATGTILAGAAFMSIYSISLVGAGAASVYTGLAPLFAVPLGVIIFKERMSLLALIGCGLAVSGVICVSLS